MLIYVLVIAIVSVYEILFVFFFTAPATTEAYTLSLHDALPISRPQHDPAAPGSQDASSSHIAASENRVSGAAIRSEEHTSELQSRLHLVCRLLLEKKKTSTPQGA